MVWLKCSALMMVSTSIRAPFYFLQLVVSFFLLHEHDDGVFNPIGNVSLLFISYKKFFFTYFFNDHETYKRQKKTHILFGIQILFNDLGYPKDSKNKQVKKIKYTLLFKVQISRYYPDIQKSIAYMKINIKKIWGSNTMYTVYEVDKKNDYFQSSFFFFFPSLI